MLDALVAEQKRLDLTDKVFSVKIGLTRSTWNRIRHHKYPLPMRTVQNAVRVFPELEEDAALFLFPKVQQVTASAHKSRRRKDPSNIDAEASEATRTLVLTTDHQTLACRGATSAPALPDRGTAALSDGDNQPSARKSYVVARPSASERSSRAVSRVGEAG